MELKYSKDGVCSFDKTTHSYFVGEKRLKGVTSYINEYKNKFDAELIATNYVKKHGGNVSDLLLKWKKEGELSCIYGSAVHEVFEKYIETKEIIITGNYEKEKQAVKFIEDYFITNRLIPVDAEIVVYDIEMGIASMIDCVARNSRNEYFILDWKTNKKIETNGYNKYMHYPYGYLPDCNYYHYSLQLALYEKMYKEHKVKDSFIVHLDNENYNIIKPSKIHINYGD